MSHVAHARDGRRLAAVAAVTGCLVVLAGCEGDSTRILGVGPSALHAVQQYPRGAATTLNNRPPPVPTAGAYLGAWVQPAHYTPRGRQAAVRTLEAQTGRRLDIVHTYRTTRQPFPGAADVAAVDDGSYLLLSFALGDVRTVVDGSRDAFWRNRARAVRRLAAPVFLEPQWEFDRPNLRHQVHSGRLYIRAWRHLRRIFRSVHVHNASWVWCPTAQGFVHGRATAFYPGDRDVDWLCADAYPGHSRPTPLADLLRPFLRWAAGRGHPTMVGEFGIPRTFSASVRAHWLRAAGRALRLAHVNAVVYFDSGIHQTADSDYRLNTDRGMMTAWREMARSSWYDTQHLTVSK